MSKRGFVCKGNHGMSEDAVVISKLNEMYLVQKYIFERVQIKVLEVKIFEKKEIREELPAVNV